MSFFFEEKTSTDVKLKPEDHVYKSEKTTDDFEIQKQPDVIFPGSDLLTGEELKKKSIEEQESLLSFIEKQSTESLVQGYKDNIKVVRSSKSSESERINNEETYEEIVDFLKSKNISLKNPFIYQEEDFAKTYGFYDHKFKIKKPETKFKEFWEQVNSYSQKDSILQQELKERQFDTPENVLKKIGVEAINAEKYHNEIYDESPASYKFGSFAADVKGTFTDPENLAGIIPSMLYGFSSTIFKTILKTTLFEGALLLPTESARQVKIQNYRKKLGFEGAGFEQGLENVKYTVLYGAPLIGATAGVAQGVGRGITKIMGKSTEDTKKALTEMQNKIDNLSEDELIKIYKEDFPEDLKTKETEDAVTILENKNTQDSINPMEDSIKSRDLYNDKLIETTTNLLNDKPTVSAEVPPYKLKDQDFMKDHYIEQFDIDKLSTDAKTFQYKSETNEFGISDKLMGVTKWDQPSASTILVYEFKDGRLAVVDGHQRFGLAKKLKDQNPKLYGYKFREEDGYSTTFAMLSGVSLNLRQGTGTAIDAAKMMRVKNFDINSIADTMPPKSEMFKTAQGLTKLSEDAFYLVLNRSINDKVASRVGEIITNKDSHVAIINLMKNQKFDNLQQLDIALRQVNELPVVKSKQTTLFGDEIFTETLIPERSILLSNAVKDLRTNKKAFSIVLREEDLLTSAGNKLDNINNQKIYSQNAKIQEKIEILATRAGQLSTDLTEAAKLYKQGNKQEAGKYFRGAVIRAAERGDFDGINASGSSNTSTIKTEIQAGTPEIRPESEIIEEKLFSDPAGKGVQLQNQALKNELLAEIELPPVKPIQTDLTNSNLISSKPLNVNEEKLLNDINDRLGKITVDDQDVIDIKNSQVIKNIIEKQDEYYSINRTDNEKNFNKEKSKILGFTKEFLNNREIIVGKDKYKGYNEALKVIYKNGAERKDRIVHIIVGLPAAGKSRYTNELKKIVKGIVIDADDFKKMLPEYKDGLGTSAVHKESKMAATIFFRKAIVNGDNIISPILGRSKEALETMIDKLKKFNYEINITHIDVPINTAKLRNFKRAILSGRYVDDNIIVKEVDDKIKTNYNNVKKELINKKAQIDGNIETEVKYIKGSREEFEEDIRRRGELRVGSPEAIRSEFVERTRVITTLGERAVDPLDQEFSFNVKLDDTNEQIPELKTLRTIREEENQTNLFIERLKDCI
jgi:hypothetical protein